MTRKLASTLLPPFARMLFNLFSREATGELIGKLLPDDNALTFVIGALILAIVTAVILWRSYAGSGKDR
jgi:hypothetical protein